MVKIQNGFIVCSIVVLFTSSTGFSLINVGLCLLFTIIGYCASLSESTKPIVKNSALILISLFFWHFLALYMSKAYVENHGILDDIVRGGVGHLFVGWVFVITSILSMYIGAFNIAVISSMVLLAALNCLQAFNILFTDNFNFIDNIFTPLAAFLYFMMAWSLIREQLAVNSSIIDSIVDDNRTSDKRMENIQYEQSA